MIDSHVNVWSERFDPRHASPSWLDADTRSRTYARSLDEIDDEMTDVGVTGVVLVQTSNHLGHTDELLAAAESSSRPATVVGWLPIHDPDETAAALERYRGQGLLVGARHRLIEESDTEFLLANRTAASLDLLEKAGLVLDVLPWPKAVLGSVARLAQRHPNLTIVIDLMGWPNIEGREMQPWTRHLTAAAAEPNVMIKVGGFYRMTADRDNTRPWWPYTTTVLEVFGPERMMMASDWPAVMIYGRSYREAVRSARDAFADLTESERTLVEVTNAERTYRVTA